MRACLVYHDVGMHVYNGVGLIKLIDISQSVSQSVIVSHRAKLTVDIMQF